jgi:hypothetical protein
MGASKKGEKTMEKTPCWILIRRLTRVDEYVCSECGTVSISFFLA